MKNNYEFFNLYALLNMVCVSLKQELDDSISLFNMTNRDSERYVNMNAHDLITSVCVLAKQICKSKSAGKTVMRICDGSFTSCFSIIFENAFAAKEDGECNIAENLPSLCLHPDAVSLSLEMAKENGINVVLFRKDNLVSFDFIFGKPAAYVDKSCIKAHGVYYISETVKSALSLF